ncbi:hypothetical protein VKT23_002805 [Stygiomarasmius scandens]|uniref:Uncharacterized protein n=1 Tax=Marasmiellus scandens TaxID=2682957 RepID=A0ABR1JZI9_9AGAR
MFFPVFVLASVLSAAIAAPTAFVNKRELVGQQLADVAEFGGKPGTAILADLSVNECGIKVNDGDLVFLVSREFLGAPPGTSAAENGLCGRKDATIFVVDNNATVLAENESWLAPVGICDSCGQGDVVVNQATFNELGGVPGSRTIEGTFPRFG